MIMYYKANQKVAEDLQVTALRRKLDDGNYILWFADMIELAKRLGVWGEETIATMVGALPLTPVQAKEEQDGKVLRVLPVPTAEKYVMPATTTPDPSPADDSMEAPTDAASETPADDSVTTGTPDAVTSDAVTPDETTAPDETNVTNA